MEKNYTYFENEINLNLPTQKTVTKIIFGINENLI
jgi:hypothetical protein